MIEAIAVVITLTVLALFVPRRQPPPDAVDYAEQEERLMSAAAKARKEGGE